MNITVKKAKYRASNTAKEIMVFTVNWIVVETKNMACF